jgi:hypothetical protein
MRKQTESGGHQNHSHRIAPLPKITYSWVMRSVPPRGGLSMRGYNTAPAILFGSRPTRYREVVLML